MNTMTRSHIDLHTHTTNSDGTFTPTQLVQHAVEVGLDVVAITDHDTISGWDEACNAAPHGLTIIRGVELSCVEPDASGHPQTRHLLAYLPDPSHDLFTTQLGPVRESRTLRAQRTVELMRADGHPITWDDVQRHIGDGSATRPHIARAMIDVGLIDSVDQAFTSEWIGPNGRYHAAKVGLDIEKAIGLVNEAGGVAVFAHPYRRPRVSPTPDRLFHLARLGLWGIEVDHPDHSLEQRQQLRNIAADCGLKVTGSSDFHRSNKTTGLGIERTDPQVLEQLLDDAKGVPAWVN